MCTLRASGSSASCQQSTKWLELLCTLPAATVVESLQSVVVKLHLRGQASPAVLCRPLHLHSIWAQVCWCRFNCHCNNLYAFVLNKLPFLPAENTGVLWQRR